MQELSGFLNVLKPPGMTSHDVVYRVRRLLGSKAKVGHLGTLDPGATGVLPLAVGRATRLIPLLPDCGSAAKAYQAEIKFGIRTLTDDLEGEILATRPIAELLDWTLARWQEELSCFTGAIDQVPPQVSAVRKDGVRAYETVRKGQVAKLEARRVFVATCQALNWLPHEGVLRVFLVCSAGTYVRAIARDLGEKLKTGGALAFLIRTLSGSFHLMNAVTLEELAEKGVPAYLLEDSFPFLKLPAIECLLPAKGHKVKGCFLPGARYRATNGLVLGLEGGAEARVEAIFSSGEG